jgi:hypothetical protein
VDPPCCSGSEPRASRPAPNVRNIHFSSGRSAGHTCISHRGKRSTAHSFHSSARRESTTRSHFAQSQQRLLAEPGDTTRHPKTPSRRTHECARQGADFLGTCL